LTDKLRKALQTPVKVDYKNLEFSAVLEDLARQAPGLSIRCTPRAQWSGVRLHFEEPLPVSSVLQALEDDYDIRFVVRDYGILVVHRRMAPPGAMTLQELLREKPPEKKKNPPADNAEGKIEQVDPNGTVRLNLGVKDGVKAGDIVEVYRLDPKPTYLGTLKIVQSLARSSVGKPEGRLSLRMIKEGDRVKSQKPRPLIQFRSTAEEKSSE
jgi:hypothetical protein